MSSDLQTSALYVTAPDFSEPLAVLGHCHGRIRKLLTTLSTLSGHVLNHGADSMAQQAAQSVLRYFTQAAPNHHADEERDLLPLVRRFAPELNETVDHIERDHREMESLWQNLAPQLTAIAKGTSGMLDMAKVQDFLALYRKHMALEEEYILPAARRVLTSDHFEQLGASMRARRGLPS